MKKLSILLLFIATLTSCEQEPLCDCNIVTYSGGVEIGREEVDCGTPYLEYYYDNFTAKEYILQCE